MTQNLGDEFERIEDAGDDVPEGASDEADQADETVEPPSRRYVPA